ncbi:MAG: serine acetyltransferase [Ruminococcus sp.]|nr:serine acetyltransferase [Ruminococcus sp.]
MNEINTRISGLVETLLDDYNSGRVIDEIKQGGHPDRKTVIDILEKLHRLVYPGYYKNETYNTYTVRNSTTMLLEDVIGKLIEQITVVLPCKEEFAGTGCSKLNSEAERLTFEFLSKIPKIREYIETDLQAFYDGDPAAYSKDEIIYSYPGMYAILTSRLAHELFLLGVPLIPRMMTEHAHSLTGIDIHPGVTLGKYFFIDHGTGIVIGETTEIGNNVKIYQGVTLGALSTRGGQKLKNKKRHPTIMDNVTIYSGASILGGDTVVGKDAVIGGNAFITSSVPAGAKVSIKTQELLYSFGSSKPMEKKEFENADNWFYVI